MFKLNILNKKQYLKLLAILALSDGHVSFRNNKPRTLRLVTSKEGIDQHTFFNFLTKKVFNQETVQRKRGEYLLLDLNNVKKVPELIDLSPSFKTTPGLQTKQDYLQSPQPTLKFLNNESKELKWLALRTYFDFDGSVTLSTKLKEKNEKKSKRKYKYFQVQTECEINIAETNPSLINELLMLCEDLGLKATKKRDKRNWSGYEGIRICNKESVLKFLKQGGPITNVLVSNKGKIFNGRKKKDICKLALYVYQSTKISKSFKERKQAEVYRKNLLQRTSKL